MGDGLQQAAGDRLRFYDKYTSNPFFGILVGIGMTAWFNRVQVLQLLQLVWLSGLLTLRQAVGLSWGQYWNNRHIPLSLDLNWEYALPMLFLGAVCLFFTKKINYQ